MTRSARADSRAAFETTGAIETPGRAEGAIETPGRLRRAAGRIQAFEATTTRGRSVFALPLPHAPEPLSFSRAA